MTEEGWRNLALDEILRKTFPVNALLAELNLPHLVSYMHTSYKTAYILQVTNKICMPPVKSTHS